MTLETFIEALTPLGFTVRCSKQYWEFLVAEKHPVLAGHEADIVQALTEPEEVRRSSKDPDVYLFYRSQEPRWICAVAKGEGLEGFLITAYPTDKIKIGETIWTRSK